MNGLSSDQGGDVALFIDWENFKISLASGHRTPNVTALKEEVGNHGRVVVAKAYADWVTRAPELRGASQFTNDPPALYAAGIEPVYVPTRLPPVGAPSDSFRTARVKNSVDVKMTADCIECAHAYSNIGTYVLVSGDSDFIHVINTLRTMGKRVIIIGVSWSTSRRLADQVDGLILYDTDVDPVATAETANNGRNQQRSSTNGNQQLSEVMSIIEEIVRSERQAGRTPLLTSLKQRVMRRLPGFDEKKMGYSGFKKLMQRVAQEGNIKLVTVGVVDWILMANEPDPQEPGSDVQTPVTDAAQLSETTTNTPTSAIPEDRQPSTNTSTPAFPEDRQPSRLRANSRPARRTPIRTFKAPPPERPNFVEPEDISSVLSDELKNINLPEGPEDGLDGQRVSDLIVMADTLEHREGISHVAFNFLVGEITAALNDGIEAENAEIAYRWGQTHSRLYITKMIRGLNDGGVFLRGWHSARDDETGRNRRRRTFNLDRNHPLVVKILDRFPPTAPEDTQGTSDNTAEGLPDNSTTNTNRLEQDNLEIDNPVEQDNLEIDTTVEQDNLEIDTTVEQEDPDSNLGKVMRFFSRS